MSDYIWRRNTITRLKTFSNVSETKTFQDLVNWMDHYPVAIDVVKIDTELEPGRCTVTIHYQVRSPKSGSELRISFLNSREVSGIVHHGKPVEIQEFHAKSSLLALLEMRTWLLYQDRNIEVIGTQSFKDENGFHYNVFFVFPGEPDENAPNGPNILFAGILAGCAGRVLLILAGLSACKIL